MPSARADLAAPAVRSTGDNGRVLSWDHQLERWIVGHRVHALNPLVEALTYAGTYGLLWLAVGGLLALALRRPPIFLWVLVADVAAELSSDALKALTNRARPTLDALVAKPSSSSFPSGHATTSFASAVVVAGLVPRLRVPALAQIGRAHV